ncbi:MAG: repair protein RecN [Pseudomonadota bacterium]|jgi:DNA repair protein RecN (Recombination protein N)
MSLHRLSLKDFVIVDTVDIELGQGFTVLTGETGAGKSILIDALQLLLGQRADAGVVRQGCTRCELSAEFDSPPSAQNWLEENGYAHDEPGLLLRRQIDAQGKSRAWINGQSATLAQLRELADYLIDIHGQHAWQTLAQPASQLRLIDEYGSVSRGHLLEAFETLKTCEQRLEQAQQSQEQALQRTDQLKWQLSEADKLAPQPHEWDELNALHTRLAHAQDLTAAAEAAAQALDNDHAGALQQLHQASMGLNHHSSIDERLAPIATMLQESWALAQEASRSLSQWMRHADLDPEQFAQIDARVSAWISMSKRWRVAPADLPSTVQNWRDELKSLQQSQDLDALQKDQQQAQQAFEQLALKTRLQRQHAASKLSEQVTQYMQTLGMKGGRFQIDLKSIEHATPFGLDACEFCVAAHPGAELRPVHKVASGGELSRIALAIAVSTSQIQNVDTLVFDEVDSGIGGRVAQTVGELMRELGQRHQVLAVTHLAQVAVCAHTHIQVSKHVEGKQTLSRLTELTADTRAQEISRMLGGSDTSAASLAHAKEMLHPYV